VGGSHSSVRELSFAPTARADCEGAELRANRPSSRMLVILRDDLWNLNPPTLSYEGLPRESVSRNPGEPNAVRERVRPGQVRRQLRLRS